MYSNEIVDDKEFVENFLPNLTFEIVFLKITDKIKINLIDEGHKEIIYANKLSSSDDIFNQLKKDYVFRLKYNNKYLFPWKFLFKYNLSNNDTTEIIKNKSNAMELLVRLGKKKETIYVYPEEPLYILAEMFNINNKYIKLIYNGVIYPVYSIFTFKEIQIENHAVIIIVISFIPVKLNNDDFIDWKLISDYLKKKKILRTNDINLMYAYIYI